MPQKRNRLKRPSWSYGGMSALEWRSIPELVRWSQTSQQFRDLITILINDRSTILSNMEQAHSEGCMLGRQQALEAVRLHLLSLTEGLKAAPSSADSDTPSYDADTTTEETTVGTDFIDSINT